jgi:Ca-activated chloride channel family protein
VIADVTVEPGAQTENVTRQVVLVIDTSGSMSGEKMERAKNGAEFVLGYLDDDDVLSIVEFDSSASVVLAADRYGDIGRETAAGPAAIRRKGQSSECR